MVAHSLFVLLTALACTMTGCAKQTADCDSIPTVIDTGAGNTKDMQFHHSIETRTKVNSLVDKAHGQDENNEDIYVKGNKQQEYDEIYTDEEDLIASNLHLHRLHVKKLKEGKAMRHFEARQEESPQRKRREIEDPKCEQFKFNERDMRITHPYAKNSSNGYYYNNSNCVTTIDTLNEHKVILFTFVDIFRIEYHPECAYDYLEIRDGIHGYADLLGKVCGQAFPAQMKTTGPKAWLKFHSDDTIEYEGFHINVEFVEGPSYAIPGDCYKQMGDMHGIVDTTQIKPECHSGSQALDFLWMIQTPEDTKIYLNFTKYKLAKPNECGENVIQVFGSVLELDSALANYCGSVANPISTKDEPGNIMYIRLYASKAAKLDTILNATYTAYITLDTNKDDKCGPKLFDCEDNTCISDDLVCNNYANCRLKADEGEVCTKEAESTLKQPHILVILVIFSLILSGMSFVFVFKCIRKLYQDHKIIKEHIRQSCEDRLDSLVGRSLTLDAKRLQRDSEPRASLERDNQTNEMFKQQRKFSKNTIGPTSIDSDFQETHIDLDDEPWRREVDAPVQPENVRIERNGRSRRSDMSKKEESIRSRTKEGDEQKEKREIRDASVGAPDTKESGCQTRESLFEAPTAPSSDGSGTNSRGFSTFGYSGATIARPATPAQTNTSEIKIELLRQVPSHHDTKPLKKPDRRPMSTETTRSAPDVIIVSKPIR